MTDKITTEIAKIEQRRREDAARLRRLQRARKKQRDAAVQDAKQLVIDRLAESVHATTVEQIEKLGHLLLETGRDKVLREELSRASEVEGEDSMAETSDGKAAETLSASDGTDDTTYANSGGHVPSDSRHAGHQV